MNVQIVPFVDIVNRFLNAKPTRRKGLLCSLFIVLLYTGCSSDHDAHRDWPVYKADAESSSYSELKQVNRENVDQLQIAWTFRPGDAPEGSRFGRSECNPIIIDGVMYATSARHRVYAIDASNGEQIWSFDPFDGGRGGGVSRGVTYWEDGADKRILFTAGDQLYAVDARTGTPIPEFGRDGKVSMNVGMRDDPETISVIPTSPGIVYQDVLIIGSEVSELYGAQPGWIRAYAIRTGTLEWTFHTIPLPGEPGHETWPEEAWKYAGGVNNWAGMSLDKERGIVYVPLGSPSYDFYGADRKGKNLYGNAIVALDAATGEHLWHFQIVHHDLWDYDLPAPPNLVTVERDGKEVDAVAQVTKHGFLFLFDRETGMPLFPVEERPVPASQVPGEEAWPTQPFPLKPAPYARQRIKRDDLSNYSPAAHDTLLRRFNSLRYEGLFTPPSLKGTLVLPGSRGGAEWGGAAYDPATGVLYVRSNDSPEISRLKRIEEDVVIEQSLYEQGRSFYMNYCASCHGGDKRGNEPTNPSLIGIKNRMNARETLDKIKEGGGKMPAFSDIISRREERAIIAYLFGLEDRGEDMEDDLLEIRENEKPIRRGRDEIGNFSNATRYINVTAYGHFRDPEGRPGIKPPWGTLNAINLNTGAYEWKIPLGNHPHLQKEGMPPTGTEGSPGPMVTAGGLVFIGGTRDKKFRAFDKATGALLWETTLPGVGSSTPSTYMHGGKQYIAISVAGSEEEPGGYIMAFTLPAQ